MRFTIGSGGNVACWSDSAGSAAHTDTSLEPVVGQRPARGAP